MKTGGARILFLLLCAGCSETPVCAPLAEGVSIIENRGPGAWQRVPHFEELWRSGGTREGEELSLPISVAASSEGRLAVADFQLAEIIIIEPDGTWRGALSRRGSGPGEVRHPVAAAWREDDALIAFDILGAKLVTMDSAGTPLGEDLPIDPAFAGPTVARGELIGITLQSSGAPILMTRFEGADRDRMQGVVVRLDPATMRVDTLARPIQHVVQAGPYADAAIPGWPRPTAAAAAGVVAVAAEDGSYRILLLDDAGQPLRQICRDVDPLPVGERELGSAETAEPMRSLSAAFRSGPSPVTPAAFGRLVVSTEGGVWVQRERPSIFGGLEGVQGVAGAQYDVFDAAGRYLGTVQPPHSALIQAVAGDVVIAFETGALDETWVVAYRLAN